MRILKVCMTCAMEAKDTAAGLGFVAIRDDGLYQMTCSKNHSATVAVQEEKFEVLPEIAVQAIVDGYYREAVASFTSGMERFFEFYVRLIAQVRKVSEGEYSVAWKSMAKQSERQLGAYITTYLLEEGKVPPLLPQKQVELRNAVIHQGRIASRNEAVDFGNAVLAVVNPSIGTLMTKYEDSVHAEISRLVRLRVKDAPGGAGSIQVMSIPTVVSVSRVGAETSIEMAITRVEKMRELAARNMSP